MRQQPVLIEEYGSLALLTLVTHRNDRRVNVDIQPALLRERFYPRSRQTVRPARQFAAETLHAWGVTCRHDDVLLCVSELATNALLHGVPPGRGYRLRMLRYEGTVRVEVHDSGSGRPRIAGRDPGAEGGRGLLLVAAVADRWGAVARLPGKAVWCEFAVGPAATVGAGEPGDGL
ncbi:ATP-binding protein [Streptomyces sp. INR7]|uniref:ATP-binding protein n=1 Tax=Streptomyces sp. INR7 TaxID=2607753 RepID=UPI001628D90E|nr:ATP-binding protein [Streptomyces sp. INR7]QNE26001.1 ATP-binding protein [Streptomyces sp. INR7]